jgi:hypothetical protein
MTTTKDALVPTMRRAFPANEVGSWIAAAGFYAAAGDALELYRLSDMRHWTLAIPDEELTRVIAVDSDHIYVSGTTSSFRLAVADLGEGD